MDRACAFLFLYILLLEMCTKDVGFICLHGLAIGRLVMPENSISVILVGEGRRFCEIKFDTLHSYSICNIIS